MVSTNYNDHLNILEFYKMKIPKSKRETKKAAERILAKKICNCVSAIVKSKRPLVPLAKTRKRTKKAKEQAAVAICRNSIFRKKGIMNYTYTCKKKQKLIPGKNGDCLMKYTRKPSIKGGKKKRKYTKKGGGDGDDNYRLGLQPLIPDKQFNWRDNIRGKVLSKEEISSIIGYGGPMSKLSGLLVNNDVIVSKDSINYYFYYVEPCNAGNYPKETDECEATKIPINDKRVSANNPFARDPRDPVPGIYFKPDHPPITPTCKNRKRKCPDDFPQSNNSPTTTTNIFSLPR